MTIRHRIPLAVLLLAIVAGSSIGIVTPTETAQGDENTATAKPKPTLPTAVDVRDFGARGDGVADDTAALQAAFDAAGYRSLKNPLERIAAVVRLPAGHYRITKPLKLYEKHRHLVIEGTGGVDQFGAAPSDADARRSPFAATQLIWDGPEGGSLIDVWSVSGLEMRHLGLIGSGKAGVLIDFNSRKGHSCGRITLEHMVFARAKIGIRCGKESYRNSAGMTFSDIFFTDLESAFQSHSHQNMGYHFRRPRAWRVGTVIDVVEGGHLTTDLMTCLDCDRVVRIGKAWFNKGAFVFNNTRIEPKHSLKKRTVLCEIGPGEGTVIFNGVSRAKNASARDDHDTPAFIVGAGNQVIVNGGSISGPVARLTGAQGEFPAWLQFDNCRFEENADPLKAIECNAFAGFELNNCMVIEDHRTSKERTVFGRTMYGRFVRYPESSGKAEVRDVIFTVKNEGGGQGE